MNSIRARSSEVQMACDSPEPPSNFTPFDAMVGPARLRLSPPPYSHGRALCVREVGDRAHQGPYILSLASLTAILDCGQGSGLRTTTTQATRGPLLIKHYLYEVTFSRRSLVVALLHRYPLLGPGPVVRKDV